MRYRNRRWSNRSRVRSRRVVKVEPLESRLLLAADLFEPNDSAGEATNLGTTSQFHPDLSIDPSGDQDYFRWTANQDGILNVDILFENANGDLDLELRDSNGQRIALSDSLSDNEHVETQVFAGQTFFVRVFGFSGTTSTYDLSIDGPESAIKPDGFEPNQTFVQASKLGIGDQAHGNLTIHSVFDEDWYSWTATQTGILNVGTFFDHASGNIDMELYDANGTLIDSANSNTDDEQIVTTVSAGQTYMIHVFTPGFVVQDDYTLVIDGPEDGVPVDQFEPNDTFEEASELPAGDQTYLGLTIHEPNNDDWYRWITPADGEVRFELFYTQVIANLALRIYDTNQDLVASSDGSGNTEKIILDVIAGDTFFILVTQPSVGTAQSYNLTIDGPVVDADALEPNDAFATPTDLGVSSDQSIDELTIHQGTLFTTLTEELVKGLPTNPPVNERQAVIIEPVAAATGGSFSLSINTPQTGSIQTGLLPHDADAKMVEVALNNAFGLIGFSVTGSPMGPYTIEFVGVLGGQDIAGLFTADVSQLTRDDSSNDDYYKWTASDSGELNVQVLFSHDLGNVDLELLDSDEDVIASSNSITDNEQVTTNVFAGQKYVIRVFGANGALQSHYQLILDGPGLAPDQFEVNDTSATAADLGAGDQAYTGLTIHEPRNKDWYKFTPSVSGTLEVDIRFDASLGALDLELYDANLSLLEESLGTGNEEHVSQDVVAGQSYYINVVPPGSGFTQPDYELIINGPGPDRDALETNDSAETAYDLETGDHSIEDLTIHVADNHDWYRWTAAGTGTLTVDAVFAHVLGDLELELYDVDQNLIASSTSSTDNEQVSAEVEAGQTVLIHTYGALGALLDNYTLQIEGNDPPVFTGLVDQTMSEDQSSTTFTYSVGDDGTNATELTVVATSSNINLLPNENIQLDGSGTDRTITLTPLPDQSGTTTITLSTVDASGGQGIAGFVLTVEGVADATTLVVEATAAGQEDTAIPLVIGGQLSDTDGSEVLTFEITDIPLGAVLSAGTPFGPGSWRLTPEQLDGLTITPPPNSDNDVTLTVSAVATESSNGAASADVGSIQVGVEAVADTPSLKLLDAAGDEDTAIPLFISSSLADTDGSETLTVVISVPAGAVLSAGTDNGDGTWTVPDTELDGMTITPQEATGNLNLTITATATETANGDTAQTVSPLLVSVAFVNDPPTISAIADQSTDEDTPIEALPFTIGDAESPVDALTVTASSDNQTLLPDDSIVIGGSGSNRSVAISPAATLSGSATITLTATDEQGGQATLTFLVTVNDVNDLPTISDIPNQATVEETPTAPIPFTIGDVESASDSLTVVGTSNNQSVVPDANVVINGTGSQRTVTITPPSNQVGVVAITISVTDEDGGIGIETFNLTVGDVNDLPTITDIGDQVTVEDTATSVIPLTVSDLETAADLLVLTAASDNPSLVPTENIALAGSGNDRSVTITPAADQSGTAMITVTVADEDGGSTSETFQLTVQSVNDAPVNSLPGSQTTSEDTALQFSAANGNAVSVSDVDANGADIEVGLSVDDGTLALASSNGLTSIQGDGTAAVTLTGPMAAINTALDGLTYTPTADFFGNTTISMVTSDLGNSGSGGALGATNSLTVVVDPTNAPPRITSSTTVDVPENSTVVTTVTAVDPDGDPITYAVSGGVDVALFAINSITGALSFVSATDFENPIDADGDNVYEIEVAATDGISGFTAQLMQVAVTNLGEDATPPSVQIIDVSPNLRAGPVGQITLVFSEMVSGFDLSDLTLTRITNDAQDVSLDSATLATSDDMAWTLGNLTGLTGASGIYRLSLEAAGSDITDLAGNPLADSGDDEWINGAGDANLDNEFNQLDLIQMLQNGKYLSGQLVTWSDGDFNGDGFFDQFDVILIQSTAPPHYLQGPYAAISMPADAALAEQATESVEAIPTHELMAQLVDAALAEDEDDE